MTEETDQAVPTPSTAALGRVATAAAVYYAAAALVMHAVQPELDPMDRFMSEYVLGPWGFLMTATFFAWAVGIGAVALALRRELDLGRAGRAGMVLLWVAAVGIAGAGAFPTDPGEPVTTSGVLHAVSGMAGLLSLGVGLLLVSLGLRRNERWRPDAAGAVALAAVFLLGFLAIMFVLAGGPGSGLAQRVSIGAALAWMALVGHRLGDRRTAPDDAVAASGDAP